MALPERGRGGPKVSQGQVHLLRPRAPPRQGQSAPEEERSVPLKGPVPTGAHSLRQECPRVPPDT